MFKAGALIVGLLIAAAIAWDAGERHYDNCVDRARTMHSQSQGYFGDEEEAQRQRRNAIAGCSRTPW